MDDSTRADELRETGGRRWNGPAPAPKGWIRCTLRLLSHHLSSLSALAVLRSIRCRGSTPIWTSRSATSAPMPNKREEQLAAKRRRYWENREELRAKQRAYNSKNREQIRAKEAARRKTNGEQINARKRQRYAEDPEFRARLLETNRRYDERNPHVRAEMSRNYAARRWGDSGRITSAEWVARVTEYGGRCAYCSRPATTQDHVVPLSRGGRHEIANVVPACKSCNSSKRDKLVSEWQEAA